MTNVSHFHCHNFEVISPTGIVNHSPTPLHDITKPPPKYAHVQTPAADSYIPSQQSTDSPNLHQATSPRLQKPQATTEIESYPYDDDTFELEGPEKG